MGTHKNNLRCLKEIITSFEEEIDLLDQTWNEEETLEERISLFLNNKGSK